MAATAFWYGNGVLGQFSGTAARRVDWVNDSGIKVALVAAAYTPNQDTHTFFSDITNEASGTGYTAGGVALASKSLSYDTSTNETRLTSSAAAWTTLTVTARYGVIYKDTGTAATSPLLGWVDFGANQSPAGINFSITPDATHGWLTLTAS